MYISKAEKKILKSTFKLIYVIIFILIIEICIFNYNELNSLIDNSNEKNVVLTLNEASLVNWVKKDDSYVSQIDPMIVFENIDLFIKNIEIKTIINNKVPYIDFFYTDSKRTEFNGDMLLKLNDVNQDVNTIVVNQDVKDIRLDLGDEEGITLSNFIVVINPIRLNIKVARIILMLFLYYCSKGLFNLQKSPEYEVIDGGVESSE